MVNGRIKVSVGAGPINLAWHVYFKITRMLREAQPRAGPIFNAEMKELVAAGANFLQLEDLGAWLPLFTRTERDNAEVADAIPKLDGVKPRSAGTFVFWQRVGKRHSERI